MLSLEPLLAALALGVSPVLLAPALAQDHDHAGQAAPLAQTAPQPMMCPMMKAKGGPHGDAKPMMQAPQGGMAGMRCMKAETPPAPPPSAAPQSERDHDHDKPPQ